MVGEKIKHHSNSCNQDIGKLQENQVLNTKYHSDTVLKLIICFALGVILSSAVYEMLYAFGELGIVSPAKQAISSLIDWVVSAVKGF